MYFPLYRPLTSSYDEVQVSRSEAVDLNNQLNHMHEDRHNHLGPGHPMALPSTGEKRLIKGGWRKDACAQSGYQDKYRMRSFEKTDACLRQDHEGDLSEATNGVGVAGHCKGDNKMIAGMQRVEECQSLEKQNTDKGDDISETSMEDSVSGLDMNPDDVVRVIAANIFGKLELLLPSKSLDSGSSMIYRLLSLPMVKYSVSYFDIALQTIMFSQQRVFAVQIFELHRLLKVQKLIAESPDLLLEGSALMGKKGSAMKKHSSDYAVKALINKSAPKGDSPKAADKMEGTAENAVTKSPPVPPQNAIQATGHQPSSVSLFPPVNGDPKMNPWSFHQAAPHQWLVPVMSPSEGLVYKPYPAHGCMGPVCGVVVGLHPHGNGNEFWRAGLLSSIWHANAHNEPDMQHQSSLNQKNGPIAPAAARSKERDLQGSTASSPSQRTQETSAVPLMEGRSALPLFPTTRISEVSPTEKPTRVIRVVPQKSTRESAARIFQSIQEERRQY
ncbi:ELF3-like protein 2 [Bienertia sinuspersici]